MAEKDSYLRPVPGGYELRVWVQPGAKKTEMAGLYQGCVKIRIKAPPVDNKANKELIAFLATSLQVKPRHIRLQSGQSSRKKVLVIEMGHMPELALC